MATRRSRARSFRVVDGTGVASGPGVPRGRARGGALAVRGSTALAIPQRGQGSYSAARRVARRVSNGGSGG